MEFENKIIEDYKSDHVITSVRVFNHPRKKVFKAWTNPKLLAKWWGPKGFTNTFYAFDFRRGGNWRFTMHGPDGKNYSNYHRVVDVVPPSKIVLNHISLPHFQVQATFESLNDKTKLTFLMIFQTKEICESVKKFAGPANEENFDRLEAVLK